jgi:hypothetical protein
MEEREMANRLWANNHWEVADDGMASLGPVDYFIARDRLCELRSGRETAGIASWPLQMADKSWAPIEPFLEAFQQALVRLQPKGVERLDISASFAMARKRAVKGDT